MSVSGRLTILADNVVSGKGEALGEHGYSALLEIGEGSVLFDTGRGGTVVHNAVVFGADLSALRKIILSHGHADHAGGLPEVLRFHRTIDVLAHPDVFLERFREEGDGRRTYGGIPYTRGYLERMGARFLLSDAPVEVDRGLLLTGEVPRLGDREAGDMDRRFCVRNGEVGPDRILDDQSLVVRTGRGLLIVLGCAHSGVINVIDHAIRLTGVDRIFGVVGGTHLGFSGDAQVERATQALKGYGIERLIPSHCTGMSVAMRLQAEFSGVYELSHVGKTLEF